MIVLGGLPLSAFWLWVWVFVERALNKNAQASIVRRAVLTAAPLWAAWLVAGTELLSALNRITRPTLVVWWMIPLLAAAYLLRRRTPHLAFASRPFTRQRWTVGQRVLLALLAALLLAAALSATFSPPTNFDSLTYHLPRQILWMQHHNVADFSTNNARQLMMSPYAEFVSLHLLVLTHSDALLNLIQWHALLLTLLAVSLLTRKLGGSRTAQLVAALLVITVPAIFLQASNTKNDIVEALWCVTAAYWAFDCLTATTRRWQLATLLGLSIGAAVLTKGTGALFTCALACVAVAGLLHHHRRRALLPILWMAAIALLLNAPHFARNYLQFGRITGPETLAEHGYLLLNETHSPRAILSNAVRNLAEESATPWPPLNHAIDDLVAAIHHAVRVSANDPRLTYTKTPYTGITWHPHEEDLAPSPAHIALLLLTLPLVVLSLRQRKTSAFVFSPLLLFATGIIAFLLFSATLRWQPWHVRLLIAPWCLLAPAVAVFWSAYPRVLPIVAAMLLGSFAPTFLLNDRPLFGSESIFTHSRESLRFHWMPHDQQAFEQAAALIAARHPRRVAFATGGNSPDYLLMHLLLTRLHPAPRFSYTNPLIHVPHDPDPLPDLIIAQPAITKTTHHRTPFTAIDQTTWFSILIPDPPNVSMPQ